MIKRLVIKNCLGIEELAFNPGKVNIISGGNEKGKTSILETIEKGLFNTKRRARFVRTGNEKAYIELELEGGINIIRTVKEDEAGLDLGSVKVTQDGHPINAPETFLKEMLGATLKRKDIFSFNPVDFMMKKDAEQTGILLSLMPIFVTPENALEWFGQAPKVNYEKHGLQVLKDLEQWFYDARREANAAVKATQDELDAVTKRLPDNYNLTEWEGKSLKAEYDQLNQAQEQNRMIKDYRAQVNTAQATQESIQNEYKLKRAGVEKMRDDTIVEIDKQIAALEKEKEKTIALSEERLKGISDQEEKELAIHEEETTSAREYLKDHTPADIEPLKAKCEETERMKSYVPLAKEVQQLKGRLADQTSGAEYLNQCVDEARKKPNELLQKTSLPIEGLGIDGKGNVTINNLPINNLSTAQQVRTCLNIARELAKDTALKLICVDKIEHLDETVRAEFIKQIEADQEFQYFITQVTDGDLKVEAR